MEAIPKDVIECAILDGQIPQCGEGAEWCEQHGNCYRCAKDIHDMMVEEIRRLKAERDRALAELDKALGEREDAMLNERNIGFNAGFDEGFASADDLYAEHAAELAEHGWARLPRDADGKYIHIGDVMEWCDSGETLTVEGIGIDALFYIDGENAEWTAARNKRHHAPTVEDTLREMLYKAHIYDEREMELLPDLIAEYAAKLQLKEDA